MKKQKKWEFKLNNTNELNKVKEVMMPIDQRSVVDNYKKFYQTLQRHLPIFHNEEIK